MFNHRKDQRDHLRRRLGSCRKDGGKIIGGAAARPFLPGASKGGGPPCSLISLIATSGGAGTKGPSGLHLQL